MAPAPDDEQPICVNTSTKRRSPCRLCKGQPGTVIDPPVMATRQRSSWQRRHPVRSHSPAPVAPRPNVKPRNLRFQRGLRTPSSRPRSCHAGPETSVPSTSTVVVSRVRGAISRPLRNWLVMLPLRRRSAVEPPWTVTGGQPSRDRSAIRARPAGPLQIGHRPFAHPRRRVKRVGPRPRVATRGEEPQACAGVGDEQLGGDQTFGSATQPNLPGVPIGDNLKAELAETVNHDLGVFAIQTPSSTMSDELTPLAPPAPRPDS